MKRISWLIVLPVLFLTMISIGPKNTANVEPAMKVLSASEMSSIVGGICDSECKPGEEYCAYESICEYLGQSCTFCVGANREDCQSGEGICHPTTKPCPMGRTGNCNKKQQGAVLTCFDTADKDVCGTRPDC